MVFLQAFTIEWTIGNLDATIAYTNYTCNIDVYYPAGTFPNGTTIYNQADLDGECCAQFVSNGFYLAFLCINKGYSIFNAISW